MMGPILLRRIIWAVDAFQESPESDAIRNRCVDAINALVSERKAEIEPVYVVPPQRVNAPFELLYPPLGFYGGEAESELNKKLRDVHIPGLLPPKVIDKPALTTTASIKALSEYAVETKTDLIVVGTQGRKGVSRLFLGSFAESLLLHSSVPIFTVGRSTGPIKSFGRILFPTDFRNTSEAIFPRVIELAKSFRATIFIYHMVSEPLVIPAGFVSPIDMASFAKDEKQRCAALASPYLEKAKLADLKTEFTFEVSPQSESDAILSAAKQKNIGLIAMAAQSGAAASMFAGSTTRQVARSSACPVWILHARTLAKSIKRKAA